MKLKPKLLSLLQHRKKEFPRERIIADLTAGLVVACIALPLSIALAIASGVTPDKGLITAVVAGFTISLLGGSRVQIAGPTGAFVVIVYGIIQQYGMQGLLVSTLLAGIILIIMGCLKFGAFLKFIPYPVTTGFTSGIAVVLFSTQINDFLGLGLSEIPSAFFAKWQFYFNNLSHTSMPTLLMGLLALVLIVFWPKRFKLFPGSLAALVITTVIVKVWDLPVATIGSTFGTIKTGLITPHFPDINFDIILKLLRPAFTIAFLAGIESLLSAVVADGMIGKKHRSNMELVATGCGNIVSALFGGLLAFFLFNKNPAKVFMGDTGSLFLGGAVCAMAFALDMPLILITVGIVYIIETLSDIIQVGYFKLTGGKRFFKMAPIHHHFEKCGWSEWKIVIVFSTVTLLMCAVSLLA